MFGKLLGKQKLNISEDDLEVVLGVQEYGQGWKWNNYKGRIP